MKTLTDKIHGETNAFIVVQFIGLAIAITSAIVLNVWAASANSSVAREAAILSAAFGFMVAGLCDFFIHRGTTYLRMLEIRDLDRAGVIAELKKYEEMKSKHSNKWIVSITMLLVWVNVTRFVWDYNFAEFTPLRIVNLAILYSVASFMFMIGARTGSVGWKFLFGKAGYVKEERSK